MLATTRKRIPGACHISLLLTDLPSCFVFLAARWCIRVRVRCSPLSWNLILRTRSRRRGIPGPKSASAFSIGYRSRTTKCSTTWVLPKNSIPTFDIFLWSRWSIICFYVARNMCCSRSYSVMLSVASFPLPYNLMSSWKPKNWLLACYCNDALRLKVCGFGGGLLKESSKFLTMGLWCALVPIYKKQGWNIDAFCI
jgi:hypothetical protein